MVEEKKREGDCNPPIVFRNVAMSFNGLQVHRDISFQICESEIVTILGPSGTGKTVLLKLMMGLLFPTGGDIEVFGVHLSSCTEKDLQTIRSKIGMLFQGAALFDSLSVYENIAYPLRERGGFSEKEIREVVKRNLSLVDLPGIEGKYPPELSGGMKKRVGLARALAVSPKIVLFDEPTTGLDPTSVRLIDDLILKLKEELDITCVLVTHDIESSKRVSDRWILVHNGCVLADGPVRHLLEHNSHVKNFVEGRWNT
ncbi:MAG: ATP-binding cassette domain-containing protein [Candidatus Dadabacteria bacterium]|nr:MAG: ATP-binding cassette domain-containing protein [Candidatus Dadabacteria bacterium]